MDFSGREFQCHIVNLLTSIYGDEIYLFPLKNDPIGFYDYCSENIASIREYLDLYTETFDILGELFFGNLFEKIDISNINDLYIYCQDTFFQSILGSIRGIISEYNCCLSPKITRSEFKNKIVEMVLSDEVTLNIMAANQLGIDLQQQIVDIINTELMAKQYKNN